MSTTLGNFYVGASGMQTSQYALNTTAHNITNAGTKGYSRQQVLLTDLTYTNIGNTAIGKNQEGLGTRIADVRLVRDRFVDKAYRNELGREQFYQTKYDVVAEVENYFGELESSDFRTYMQELWSAAQELQKESNSIVTRSSYIASAVTFVDQANEIYKQLTTYQKNLNAEIQDQVNRINEIADEIYDLNYKITMVEASGIESANDYRDQRDALLDELGGLVSVSYRENADAGVDVYIEHRCLVSMDKTYKLDVRPASDSCEYYVPIWKDDKADLFNVHGAKVEVGGTDEGPYFNPNDTIWDSVDSDKIKMVIAPNAESGTDVGSLKGIIMSRGDWVANYTDIPKAPTEPTRPVRSNYDNDADYNAALDQYQNVDYPQYQQDYARFLKTKDYYNTYLEPYTVNNIIAQFDQLINGIVTKINDVLCPNKEIELADGSKIMVLDEENAGYGMGDRNQVQGTELFIRNTMPRYTEQTVTLADGTSATVQVYNQESASNYLSLYSMGNIQVNDELIKNPSLLPLTNLQNEELQSVADQLIHIWDEPFTTIGPNSLVTNDFMGYYKEFIADFANKGSTYNGIAESQNKSVLELDNQRQVVLGVSTDEELSNLIKFQQGFNAASRYFTVVSEMVEHLIMKLGS
ncbi:MAG: flagellar hook-associated protein FlgK [Lachnospiraceae bacterium]|jgi:flagellar hook-associated protein 1 FlgK|nr:flagellar hook-associated protein FlgK [Lachnospiraceae bacterium]